MERAAVMRCRGWIGAVLALYAAAAAADEADRWAEARKLFTAAYAAAEAGVVAPRDGDPKALRQYPLYPYLQRARIARGLDEVGERWTPVDDAARKFLDRHTTEPVAEDLKALWLGTLASRAQWKAFVAHYDPAATDPVLGCDLLRARIALGRTADLVPLALDRWLTGERLPAECEPVFQWLRDRGDLPNELIAERAKLLLANGQTAFARVIARRLPQQSAAPLLQWAELLEDPQEGIDALLGDAALAEQAMPEALLAAWSKLARDNPPAAIERFTQFTAVTHPDAKTKSQYALALALGLAWDRRATEALHVFATVDTADLDDYARGWQARAALWAADWRQVQESVAEMSPLQQAAPRWRYWAARAAEQLGDQARARALYELVIPSDNYYAASSAARLGRLVEPHPEQLPYDSDDVDAIARRPEFVRSLELLRCGLRIAAVKEWLAGIAQLDAGSRSQAIRLATQWQWHDVAVALATRENVFFDYALLYPRPYDVEIESASSSAGVDAPLFYGVVRQESLFRPDAVSPSGAVGLAQLMPGTARRLARANQQPVPSATDLFDPAVNLRLGAAHLRELIDRFDGQLLAALAAYNAGPLPVDRWLPEEPMDADIWVENIPYNETRDYVQRVLWHSVVFGWLTSGEDQDFGRWSRPIVPHRSPEVADASAG
jgi:peptidoglycan lytic transglycosylase